MKTTLFYRDYFTNHFTLKLCWLKILMLLLTLGFIIPSTQAQVKEWDKTIGGNSDDLLPFLRQTSDGGYILGGWSASNKSGDKSENSRGGFDYWVVKLNADGSKAWDKTFGGNYDDLLTSLQQTNDGGYLLGGFSESDRIGDKSEASKGGADYWVVKLNADGSKAWDKTFGGNGGDYGQFLQQTFDGGYLVGGYSNSDISSDKSEGSKGNYDYWVLKVKADGTKVWDKTLGGNIDDKLTILQQTNDEGYLIGGYSNSENTGDKSETSRGEDDYWVVKLDVSGKKVWDKTFGGDFFDNLQFLQQTLDGGYILGGYSGSGISGDRTQASKGGFDYWIIKLQANGTKVWDKAYGGTGDDYLSALQQLNDGSYILGGSASYGTSSDKTEAGKGDLDYWVVKIKADGTIIWDKTIGGNGYELLNSIATTNDGSYIMGGWSYSGSGGDKTEVSNGGYDYWVVKLKDLDSPPNPYCVPLITTNCSSGIYINSFGFHTLSNNSSCNNQENSYLNYNPVGSLTTNLQRGQSYSLQLQSGPNYPQGFGIWIDYNNDQDFNDTGEFVYHSPAAIGTVKGNIIIPTYVTTGVHRLRVRTRNNDTFAHSESCTSVTSGETEDYTILIEDNGPQDIPQWNWRYGGSGNEGLLAVIKTSDGGYLAGGYSNSGSSGDKTQPSQGKNDYWLVKTDAAGKKLWEKRYGGPDNEYLNRMVQTLDGGYLLAGTSLSGVGGDKTQPSRGGRDYWVVKISSTGVKQWDQRYGGSGADDLQRVLLLPTGEYILAGYSNSPIGGDKSQQRRGGTDYWLVKINHNGTKLWDKRYGGTLNETLTSVVQTSDGGLILGGSSASGRNGEKSEYSRGGSDYWLVRTDKQGIKLWDKSFGGSGEDEAYSLGRSGENFFISGQSDSPAGGDKTRGSLGGKDYWLVKFNPAGSKIWDKRFGGSKDDELRASIPTSDGGFLLAGRSYSGVSGNKTQASQGSSDYWLIKADKDGIYQWDKRFGGSEYEELRAVTQAPDGGYVLAGRSASGVSGDKTQPSQGGTDFWLVKVAPETNSLAMVNKALQTEESVAQATDLVTLTASPNPFQERVFAHFILPETQSVTVKVYDSQGREIVTLFQGEAKANQIYQVEWQAGKQATGMYLLQLQTPTKRRQQKLLLAR